jgi:hypothetical protein
MCATAGKDGRAAAVELRSGKKKGQGSGRRGGCIFIWQGAFLTMEHLLATMVSVPPSLGQMPAKGIMEHLLATMVSLHASPLSIRQATIIFFLYRLLTLTRGPNTIFSKLKLASLKYYTP